MAVAAMTSLSSKKSSEASLSSRDCTLRKKAVWLAGCGVTRIELRRARLVTPDHDGGPDAAVPGVAEQGSQLGGGVHELVLCDQRIYRRAPYRSGSSVQTPNAGTPLILAPGSEADCAASTEHAANIAQRRLGLGHMEQHERHHDHVEGTRGDPASATTRAYPAGARRSIPSAGSAAMTSAVGVALRSAGNKVPTPAPRSSTRCAEASGRRPSN
jgi:hypothetical protein